MEIVMKYDSKKLLANNSLLLAEALSQARLKDAGITVGKDLGLPSPRKKYPAYVNAFVKEQMRRIKIQRERAQKAKRKCTCDYHKQ